MLWQSLFTGKYYQSTFIKLISGEAGIQVFSIRCRRCGIDFGSFISAIIIAVIVFLLEGEAINRVVTRKNPLAQVCPHCLEEVRKAEPRAAREAESKALPLLSNLLLKHTRHQK